MKAKGKSRRATRTGTYRLGLYDPDPEVTGVIYLPTQYPGSRLGCRMMREVIAKYNAAAEVNGDMELCIAAFAVEADK